jgi:hypothetical protein
MTLYQPRYKPEVALFSTRETFQRPFASGPHSDSPGVGALDVSVGLCKTVREGGNGVVGTDNVGAGDLNVDGVVAVGSVSGVGGIAGAGYTSDGVGDIGDRLGPRMKARLCLSCRSGITVRSCGPTREGVLAALRMPVLTSEAVAVLAE